MEIFRAHGFNLDDVKEFIELHERTVKQRLLHLKAYYDGYHDILKRNTVDPSKPNNHLVNNFPDYIVNQAAAYFMGTPVSYSSDNEEFLSKLQEIYNYNDEQDINSQHAENMGIYGNSFEIHYIDKEDKFIDTRFAVISPLEMFMVYNYDISPSPLYAVRYSQVPSSQILNVSIYTTDKVLEYTLSSGVFQLNSEIEHFYADVPVIEVINNNDRVGDFEKVISLIDAYNELESDSLNDFEYFSDAYLFLKGAYLSAEEAQSMKENRLINVQDENAEASFLVKNIPDTALENYKNRLVNDIHKFSSVPNLTDESFSNNLSGVAIKYKLMGLENIAGKKERRFKHALQRRVELLSNLLYIRGITKDSNYLEINMTFKRTLPANALEEVEMVRDLAGTISNKTLISLLSFVDDTQLELQRIQDENTDEDSFARAFPTAQEVINKVETNS